jgi:hypothetical protein
MISAEDKLGHTISIVAALAFFLSLWLLDFPKPGYDDLFYSGAALNMTGGLGFLAAAILAWRSVGFVQLFYPQSLRPLILSVTCMTLGVQIIFSSFFPSILELKHD